MGPALAVAALAAITWGKVMAGAAPIRRPELGELEALITALRTGSIGEAARRLGVSQPALSKRLRQLEAVCGARLLDRSPQGVVATPAGSRLATAALRVLDEVGLLDDVVAELRGQSAPVRIASSPVVADRLLPELLASARDALTGLPIELTAANSAVVRRLVESGAADLGIAATDDPESDPGAPVLATDEVAVVVAREHPWAGRASVSLEELAATELVLRDPRSHARTFVDRVMRERGLGVHPLVELGSSAAAVSAALETGHPAVLSNLTLRDDPRIVTLPIEGVRLARRFVLIEAGGAEHRRGSVTRARAALLAAAGV
jgi:DNA-binding transcriptional LysR family regulator